MYNCEKVMNIPLAMPSSRRPAYKPEMSVVAIMTTFDMMHKRLAIQIVILRPTTEAMGPAAEELRKAPSVIREEINCCRSVEMFHPPGRLGSS